jgi:hypothetical protein
MAWDNTYPYGGEEYLTPDSSDAYGLYMDEYQDTSADADSTFSVDVYGTDLSGLPSSYPTNPYDPSAGLSVESPDSTLNYQWWDLPNDYPTDPSTPNVEVQPGDTSTPVDETLPCIVTGPLQPGQRYCDAPQKSAGGIVSDIVKGVSDVAKSALGALTGNSPSQPKPGTTAPKQAGLLPKLGTGPLGIDWMWWLIAAGAVYYLHKKKGAH